MIAVPSSSALRPPEALRALAIEAVVLDVILGIGAFGGGQALMRGPHGELLPLPISLLTGSPFDSYFGPGLLPLTVLGVGPIAVALSTWRRHRWAPLLSVGVGLALLIWMAVETVISGYATDPPLQPIYIGLGIGIGLVGIAWLRQTGLPFRMRPAARTGRRPWCLADRFEPAVWNGRVRCLATI